MLGACSIFSSPCVRGCDRTRLSLCRFWTRPLNLRRSCCWMCPLRRLTRLPPSACGICSRLGGRFVSRWMERRSAEASIPLELLRPRPSLSTTSSAHCTDRSFMFLAPRRRSTRAGCPCEDTGIEGTSVVVCVWDGPGVDRRDCCCDMANKCSFSGTWVGQSERQSELSHRPSLERVEGSKCRFQSQVFLGDTGVCH